MVVDGATEKLGLFVGKVDRNGLGLNFSSPAPVALWTLTQAALSHQGEELSFTALETFFKNRNLVGRKQLFFHRKSLSLHKYIYLYWHAQLHAVLCRFWSSALWPSSSLPTPRFAGPMAANALHQPVQGGFW